MLTQGMGVCVRVGGRGELAAQYGWLAVGLTSQRVVCEGGQGAAGADGRTQLSWWTSQHCWCGVVCVGGGGGAGGRG